MPGKKLAAVDAAMAVLRGINGSSGNYNTDLENRVYDRLFTPLQKPEVKMPFVCLPLEDEGEEIGYEGLCFTGSWRLVGSAFFQDNPESDPLFCDGGRQAGRFRDDLIRAFTVDQHLGREVLDCSIIRVQTSAGVIDDGISEVVFTLEFTQVAGPSDLGAV
jgi:hypothetical protein